MNNGAVAEVATIEKVGVLKTRRMGGRPRRHNSTAIERGEYVPDEAHVDICLNCTRATCTGRCKLVRGGTTITQEGV